MKRFGSAIACVALLGSFSFAADLAGDANYKSKCAMCHGAAGEGKAAMKVGPLKDSAAKSDSELTSVITNGKPPRMPAFKGKLADADVKTLVSEIKALK